MGGQLGSDRRHGGTGRSDQRRRSRDSVKTTSDGVPQLDGSTPHFLGKAWYQFTSLAAAASATTTILMANLSLAAAGGDTQSHGFTVDALRARNPEFRISVACSETAAFFGKDTVTVSLNGVGRAPRPRSSTMEHTLVLQDPGIRDRNLITEDQWRTIAAPTLSIASGQDFSEYSNTSRRVAELMPNATVVEVPDVKHWPHFEDAARFNEIAIGFLLGVSGKLA